MIHKTLHRELMIVQHESTHKNRGWTLLIKPEVSNLQNITPKIIDWTKQIKPTKNCGADSFDQAGS